MRCVGVKNIAGLIRGEDMKELCLSCGDKLPPLNGSEENDFAFLCEECRVDMGRDGEDL